MAALDWGFLALLLLSLLLGAWRGLVFELLSLVGWVVAFFVARAWAIEAGALLPLGEAQAAWRPAAGFALTFIVTVFACGLFATLGRKLVAAAGLRPADRALGAMFGLARGGVLLLLLVWLAGYTPLVREAWWQQSHAAPWLAGMVAQADPDLAREWMRDLPWQLDERGREH